MSGITSNGAAAYMAALEQEADSAIRDLVTQLASAATVPERAALQAQIKAIRDELARQKALTKHALF
jgi:flagellin-like hook-associated protein FlgL